MEEELESFAALIQPWHEQREQMRARAAQWIRSAAFRDVFYDDAHPPLAAKVLLAKELKRKEAAALLKNADVFGVQKPELWQQYQELAEQGLVVFGQVIIINPDCSGNPHHNLPCLVLVPEDQSPMAVTQAGVVAAWLGEIYAGLIPEERALAKLLRDDDFQLFRRRTLPTHPMMRGEGHLLDVALRMSWLPTENMLFVPLLIKPGRRGAVLQIPWSIATGTPPVPGSMEPGIWAEYADLDREADRLVAEQKSKRGCGFWIYRAMSAVFFLGLAMGLVQLVKDMIWPPPPVPASQSAAGPGAHSNIVWKQAAKIRRETTPVSPQAYRPLQLASNNGYAFLLALPEGPVVAASARGSSTAAPGGLFSDGKPLLTLDTANVLTQRHSRIQLVTDISSKADTLAFDPDAVLEPGDIMLIIPAQGSPIPCTLALTKPHPLNAPAKKLQLTLPSPGKSGDLSGCPVVRRKTGKAAGVLQAPDPSATPTIHSFETISLTPP